MLTFDDLVHRHAPLIHNERTVTWAIHPGLAEFLDAHVEPGMATLETGAGLSTLVILRKGPGVHVAVQPNADEFTVIAEFAEAHGIDTRAFRAIVAKSQHYLPTADLPALDLVLIDGDHSFPAPFLDWFYTAERLRVGGLMIVDDIQIGTGAILASFLRVDPKWEEVLVQAGSFAIYRKRIDFIHLGDWMAQPFFRDAYPTVDVLLIRSGVPPLVSESELIAARKELESTRVLLKTVGGERDQALHAGRQGLDAAREAGARIRAMENTKFWKLRNAWFRVRRVLGLPGRE